MRKYAAVLALISLLFMFPEMANAACKCRCVDGENVPLCSSTLDIVPHMPPSHLPNKAAVYQTHTAADDPANRYAALRAKAGSQPLYQSVRMADGMQVGVALRRPHQTGTVHLNGLGCRCVPAGGPQGEFWDWGRPNSRRESVSP